MSHVYAVLPSVRYIVSAPSRHVAVFPWSYALEFRPSRSQFSTPPSSQSAPTSQFSDVFSRLASAAADMLRKNAVRRDRIIYLSGGGASENLQSHSFGGEK